MPTYMSTSRGKNLAALSNRMLELSPEVNKYLKQFSSWVLNRKRKSKLVRPEVISDVTHMKAWYSSLATKIYTKIAIVCRCSNRLSRPAKKN